MIRKTLCCFFVLVNFSFADSVSIIVPDEAPSAVRSAAADLRNALRKVFPDDAFEFGKGERFIEIAVDGQGTFESFRIRKTDDGKGVRILGADPLGAVFGVYELLEQYGCGFYLTYDTFPEPRRRKWTPPQNDFEDAPLVRERYSFNWHNFLSGCTGWDEAQWLSWIDQCRKLRYNVIMVHAYGNNPMFTFQYEGIEKPVGYLANTARGRDWGTPHVNDVRRMVGGEHFNGPVFGAPASLVPPEQRAAAVQSMMKKVFSHVKAQGMKLAFQLDVDTFSANPAEMMRKLPEDARFLANKSDLRPLPDTAGGKAYYRTVLSRLLKLYPEIDNLVVCTRTAPQPGGFSAEHFPESWKAEYAELKKDKGLSNESLLAGYYWTGKVVKAFQELAPELKRDDLVVSQASWWFQSWIPYADACSPKNVAFLPLDWAVVLDRSELDEPGDLAFIRKYTQTGRRIIPITWSHHDDGHYIGRTYTPHRNFATLLAEAGCDSFGTIHWLLRPHGLFFKSQSVQTWTSTKNQPLEETCRNMAKHLFGVKNEQVGGDFLLDWITNTPMFGRDTSNYMIDRPFKEERFELLQKEHARRKELLGRIDAESVPPGAARHLAYWNGLEDFNVKFWKDETLLQKAVEALKKDDAETARKLIEKTDPRSTLKQYADYASQLGLIPGDFGLMVLMNLKWYPTFVGTRQLLGLEPYRINFGPTYDEPLAQGAGSLSFHLDRGNNLWLVRGAREVGGEQWDWPKNRPMKAYGLSDAEKEIARSGVAWTKQVNLSVLPAMTHRFQSTRQSGVSSKAARKLTLYAADPFGREGTTTRFALTLHVNREYGLKNDFKFEPAPAKFLRINCRGNSLSDWNSIYEIETPSRKKGGAVQASRELPDYKASAAVDGNPQTRWAISGASEWIQVELDPNVPLESLRIDWYGDDNRQYVFDLEVSMDGKQWKSIDFKDQGTAPKPLSLGTLEITPGNAKKFEFSIPRNFHQNFFLSVEPKSGKVSICGLILE